MNFSSLPKSFHRVNFPFSYWIPTCLKKYPLVFFFLKKSHFCTVASIFWQVRLQIRHNSDTQSGIKFLIGPPVKLLIKNFITDWWSVPADNKSNAWHIHESPEAVGYNISASLPFNDTIVVCFWYFNSNIFSVIIPLAFNKVIFPQFRFLPYTHEFCSPYFFHVDAKRKFKSKFLLKTNYFNPFQPMFHFYTPWKIKKPEVFWRF